MSIRDENFTEKKITERGRKREDLGKRELQWSTIYCEPPTPRISGETFRITLEIALHIYPKGLLSHNLNKFEIFVVKKYAEQFS